MKQGDKITAKIIDYGNSGEGIAKPEGYVVFIPYTAAGETVEARITYAKKDFAHAVLLNVVEPSPERVSYPCNRFGRCGGCTIMHLSYPEQLRMKEASVKTTMEKAGLKDLPYGKIVPSDCQYGYRNKVQLPFGIVNGKAALGFYKQDTHKIVSITKCFLHEAWLEKLIRTVLDFTNGNNLSVYDETTGKGLLRHLVARYLDDKLSVVLVATKANIPYMEKLIAELDKQFPDFSLYISINPEKTNVIMGKDLVTVKKGADTYNASGVIMTVHPLSFLQVNNNVREKLYNNVLNAVKGGVVIDAYSGIGLLGAYLIKQGAKHVYNIEIVPEAVKDAEILAQNNNISDKVTNITGDASEKLPEAIALAKQTYPENPLTLIVDPPRKGITKELIQTILSADIPNLVYISCNPATLARDLKLLTETRSYRITQITPHDMFPNTHHVETVCLMSRVKD